MPMTWFPKPQTDRLDLGDGFWIEVKRHLTAGEEFAMRGAGISRMQTTPRENTIGERKIDPSMEVDFVGLALGMCRAYIVNWNLTGIEGEHVAYAPDLLEKMPTPAFEQIRDAVNAHHERWSSQEGDDPEKKRSDSKRSKTS